MSVERISHPGHETDIRRLPPLPPNRKSTHQIANRHAESQIDISTRASFPVSTSYSPARHRPPGPFIVHDDRSSPIRKSRIPLPARFQNAPFISKMRRSFPKSASRDFGPRGTVDTSLPSIDYLRRLSALRP
jgi:hypothetical protein